MIRTSTVPAGFGRVLVVDDHAAARQSMAECLRLAGHQVDCCTCAAEALRVVDGAPYDCIVTDLRMPGMSGLEFIEQLQRLQYGAQVVMVTAHATVAVAVEAMRHGAFDFIEKPFRAEQLEELVGEAVRQGRSLRGDTGGDEQPPAMVGSSPAMRALRAKIQQVAPTPETVLITGESGTGKELVARALHAASPRRENPLISLNCPVLSTQLTESELFGHERGAFTGAESSRRGRFEQADHGTLLLDEISEIDLSLQAKLLRVLQEKSFERVGSSETIAVDTRVLATTNRDLREEVARGRFRQDLYYRLAVVPIQVPPLRDRRDDIPELIDHFRSQCAARLQREPCRLESDALALLIRYEWPGNVRELENIVTRASVLHQGQPVSADMLRDWLIGGETPEAPAGPGVPVGLSLEEMERRLIEATLEQYDGHRARTAKALGIGLRTLTDKLRRYGYAPREKPARRAA